MNKYFLKSTDKKDRYIIVSNSECKSWIVPIRNMRTALNIYQPSRLKGRLLKRVLPYFYPIALITHLAKARLINIKLKENIREIICAVLGLKDFEFSIFSGTPSVHQKVTLQISQGKKIIAYCKLSNNPEIINLFTEETKMLNQLHKQGIDHIPTCLYCGKVTPKDNTQIFIQSTRKTNRSHNVHNWGKKHWQFLEELHQHTKVRLPFAKSDFARSLENLEGYIDPLPNKDQIIIKEAIKRVRRFYGDTEVDFSAFHGDFTPWNMILEAGELFVFDLEYAGRSYPPYLDWFHYFTQVGIIEKCYVEQKLVEFCQSQLQKQKQLFENIHLSYTQYLLSILSFYMGLTHGKLEIEDRSYKSWINLIDKLNEQSNH